MPAEIPDQQDQSKSPQARTSLPFGPENTWADIVAYMQETASEVVMALDDNGPQDIIPFDFLEVSAVMEFPYKGAMAMLRDAITYYYILVLHLKNHGNILRSAAAAGIDRAYYRKIYQEVLGHRPKIQIRLTEEMLNMPFVTLKNHFLRKFSQLYCQKKLEEAGGNVSLAARRSGIDRKYFRALLEGTVRWRGAGKHRLEEA